MTANESLENHIIHSHILPLETGKPRSTPLTEPPIKQKQLAKKRKIDRRSGIYKLKKIILELRPFFEDEDEILREDLINAINDICGTDERTERKYEQLLLRRHYLEPIGLRHQKVTRVNVRTYSHVDGSPNNNLKEYRSNRGHTAYKFGLFAPKLTQQIPLANPPSTFNERVVNMGNMCVSQGRGEAKERGMGIERREGGGVLSHTHISTPKSFALNMSKTNMPNLALKVLNSAKQEPKSRDSEGRWLSDEERRILEAAEETQP